MIWSGSAEGTFNIRFPAAITTDESRIDLEPVDFCYFAGFGQFTEMQLMIGRIGAKVVNIR
jgi:hypothetical protein